MKNYFVLISVLSLALLMGNPAFAAHSPVIDDIIRMYQAGLSEIIILDYLKANQIIIELTADDIITLRQVGLSEDFIAALIELMGAPPYYAEQPPAPYYPSSYYASNYYGSSLYPNFFYFDSYPHIHLHRHANGFLHDGDHVHHDGHTFVHRDDPSLPYHGNKGFFHDDDHVHHDGHTYVHEDNYFQFNGHDYFRHNGHFHVDDAHQLANSPKLTSEPHGQFTGSFSGTRTRPGLQPAHSGSWESHPARYGSADGSAFSSRSHTSYFGGAHNAVTGTPYSGGHSGTSSGSSHSSHGTAGSSHSSHSSSNHRTSSHSHSSGSSHSHSGSHSSGHSHN